MGKSKQRNPKRNTSHTKAHLGLRRDRSGKLPPSKMIISKSIEREKRRKKVHKAELEQKKIDKASRVASGKMLDIEGRPIIGQGRLTSKEIDNHLEALNEEVKELTERSKLIQKQLETAKSNMDKAKNVKMKAKFAEDALHAFENLKTIGNRGTSLAISGLAEIGESAYTRIKSSPMLNRTANSAYKYMKKNTPAGIEISETYGELGKAMERLSKKRRGQTRKRRVRR